MFGSFEDMFCCFVGHMSVDCVLRFGRQQNNWGTVRHQRGNRKPQSHRPHYLVPLFASNVDSTDLSGLNSFTCLPSRTGCSSRGSASYLKTESSNMTFRTPKWVKKGRRGLPLSMTDTYVQSYSPQNFLLYFDAQWPSVYKNASKVSDCQLVFV